MSKNPGMRIDINSTFNALPGNMSEHPSAFHRLEQYIVNDLSAVGHQLLADVHMGMKLPPIRETLGYVLGNPATPELQLTDKTKAPDKIDQPGTYSQTILVDGIPRHYLLHVPPTYKPDQPMPLVLALHGHGWNSKDMEKYSGMDKEADKKGFIVAYPDATRWLNTKELSAWDTGNGLLPKGTKVNDIGFLRTIIDTTQGQMNIDPKRIYAMGESNGGMLAYLAASELSDKLAAVVSVSGGMSGKERTPDNPVSVLSMVGTKDNVVPPQGGTKEELFHSVEPRVLHEVLPVSGAVKDFLLSPIPQKITEKVADHMGILPEFKSVDYATQFFTRTGSSADTHTQTVRGKVTTDTYTDPQTGAVVEQQVFDGADHILEHGTPKGFSMSADVWDFLEAHPKK